MLVIARKRNEKILIETPMGEKITIILAGLQFPEREGQDGKARIGFIANRDIIISREETLPEKLPVTLADGTAV